MIEYARGPLLTLIPFGLANGLLSTLDFKAVYQTLAIYCSLLTQQLSPRQKMIACTLALAVLALWTARGRRQKRTRRASGRASQGL
jgi:hypothetical protein